MDEATRNLIEALDPLMLHLEESEKCGERVMKISRDRLQALRRAFQVWQAGSPSSGLVLTDPPEWIQTYSGLPFEFKEGSDAQILIVDIAHSLSLKCRFGGHCLRFYSVAEHSVRVMAAVRESLGSRVNMEEARRILRAALTHDVHEAYTGDATTPVKVLLGPIYRQLVEMIDRAVERVLDVDFHATHEWVKAADMKLLATEQRDLMAPSQRRWNLGNTEPLSATITPLSPEDAERAFLAAWKSVGP
jgi:hypothetical protein